MLQTGQIIGHVPDTILSHYPGQNKRRLDRDTGLTKSEMCANPSFYSHPHGEIVAAGLPILSSVPPSVLSAFRSLCTGGCPLGAAPDVYEPTGTFAVSSPSGHVHV